MQKPEKKDCEPYCTLLKEVMSMLAIFPFDSEEAKWAATEAKKAISAIQERTFERMYYEARKDLSRAYKIIEELQFKNKKTKKKKTI